MAGIPDKGVIHPAFCDPRWCQTTGGHTQHRSVTVTLATARGEVSAYLVSTNDQPPEMALHLRSDTEPQCRPHHGYRECTDKPRSARLYLYPHEVDEAIIALLSVRTRGDEAGGHL